MEEEARAKHQFSEVLDKLPKVARFPIAVIHENGKKKYVVIKSQKDSDLLDWYEDPSWKGKEGMFGAVLGPDEYLAIDNKELYIGLKDKLKIKSNNREIELDVQISSVEDNDKKFLHYLLSKVRKEK